MPLVVPSSSAARYSSHMFSLPGPFDNKSKRRYSWRRSALFFSSGTAHFSMMSKVVGGIWIWQNSEIQHDNQDFTEGEGKFRLTPLGHSSSTCSENSPHRSVQSLLAGNQQSCDSPIVPPRIVKSSWSF